MNKATSLTLVRMRAPFLAVIAAYSISILGMVLIPGVDDQGNVWHMSFFHAFYFVSFTATTIGFGEIPYPLTDAQRLWALVTVYMTVVAWFYALGKIIALVQDKTYQQVAKESHFKREVKKITQPFYLICGLGETGHAVVKALTSEHYRVVVVDQQEDKISHLALDELKEFVPSLVGDASIPNVLELAGVKQPNCRGVIAVTPNDETNLKIAITSKLLHPDMPVICRSEIREFEDNMKSFDTDYIVNPYKTFSNIFAMAIHSPSLHLIYDWLTGAPDASLTQPIQFGHRNWILNGFGRFGQHVYEELRNKHIPTTVIDPSPEAEKAFMALRNTNDDQFILGTGTDEKTLKKAGIETASGIIAGSNNDSNNLSAIMTARAINPKIFVVARQNTLSSELLYAAINDNYSRFIKRNDSERQQDTIAHLVMRPREIIGRKIRALLINPLLLDFLDTAKQQSEEWANITISRLIAVVGDINPQSWSIFINFDKARAVAEALGYGRNITLANIIQDPKNRQRKIKCVPLLIKRNNKIILMPDDDIPLRAFDQILFCGTREAKDTLHATITYLTNLNYVMTFRNDPVTYVWKKLNRFFKRHERRHQPRD